MAITQIKSTGIANGAVTSENLGTLSNISVSGTSNLGNVGNVVITGGSVGQVLTTDGTGNLSWEAPAATGPTITQIQITDSSYNVLDDTAVSTSGGYIKVTGTNFSAGAIVVIGSINAISTTFISSTVLNVQVPSAVAGTYTVYVVNTNGSTAIGVNGLTYSGTPNWVTGSTLPSGLSGSPISIQLSATGDAPFTYALAAGNTLPTGLTLTSGGLLSGTVTVANETVYAFTIIAIDAEAQDSPRAFTITITNADPYFYLTTLLLPGNGTNNGTNNTFLDGSTNAFTITKNGNTAQGTFSPFSQTGWSNYFGSSTSNLVLPSNAVFAIGTGNFTIEGFVNFTTWSGTNQRIFLQGVNGTDGIALYRNSGANNLIVGINNTEVISYSWTPNLGQWYYLAVVRSGTGSNQVALYIDGVSVATGTSSASIAQNQFIIGGLTWASSYNMQGYISNVRYSNNARTITVPTSNYISDANTIVLTCQNNRFIDNSTNNFTITRNGDVSVQSFSPFAPGSSYSAGTVGGSAYFDGSGDWLSFGAQSAFDCGTSTQFCMEAWVYPPTSYPNGIHFWSAHQAAVSDGFYFTSSGLYVYSGGGAGTGVTTNKNPPVGAWSHCVLTRDGTGRLRYFLNGELTGTSTSTVQVNTDGKAVGINGGVNFTGDAGYQSQSRYIKGSIPTAYQTSSTTLNTQIFTPPTAPLTTTSQGAVAANVIALVNYTNGQIIDATSKNLLETVGDAKISTAQSKFGGSSMSFDGTGDWLKKQLDPLFYFAADDFTVETWIYLNSIPNPGGILCQGDADVNTDTRFFVTNTGLSITTQNATRASASFSWSTGTWYHVAFTRQSGVIRIFVDGNLLSTTNYSTAFPTPTTYGIYIGADSYRNQGIYTINGYMNDLRVTKGYARYTANFTPPTSAFATL